jgi:hypothetical protein
MPVETAAKLSSALLQQFCDPGLDDLRMTLYCFVESNVRVTKLHSRGYALPMFRMCLTGARRKSITSSASTTARLNDRCAECQETKLDVKVSFA